MAAQRESFGSADAVDILPIPPALVFPYPRPSTESSTSPSKTEATTSEPINSVAANGGPAAVRVRSDGQTKPANVTESRPTIPQKKFVTERPSPAQRISLLGIRRRQTNVPTPQSQTDWDSDSDTGSSSDENGGSRLGPATNGPPNIKSTTMGHAKNLSGARQEKNPYSYISTGNDNFKTRGRVSKRDGRLNISLKETANRGYLAKAVGTTLQRHLKGPGSVPNGPEQPLSPLREGEDTRGFLSRSSTATSTTSLAPSAYDKIPRPKLNIVIMVIGSRGDIQPFLRLGKILKEEHGHCVRIATHPAFKKFVEQDSGLEFFSVGGDPAEIMAFMVKNPGLIPKAETIRTGEIGRRRESMYEMFQGFWRACINATDDEKDVANLKMMGDKAPFVADAIIANPPSIAHVHCAERLGIPLHLIFTFPNSPTQQFPHPLTNIKQSNVDANYTNFMSYPLVEMMIWQGLGDLVNRFRVKTLGLDPLSTLWAPGQSFRLKIPYTYLWSPGLIPKPADWGPEIDVTGFVFLDLASSFKPPEPLTKFLEEGEPPVYIGFGSIVVDDPDKFTALIFQAVEKAGVRALVSKGWGELGDEDNTPSNVFMLENTPHDWLFPRVSAVVHHGGAGTTAIGLKCGKPTMIVPFFGDQPFWGAMVAKAGAGVEPVPYKRLTADKLAEGIKELLTPEVQKHAEKIARDIDEEGDGAVNAVKSFHRSLPLRGEHSMRCSILEDRVAVWQLKNTHIRLSTLAAEILIEQRRIQWQDLRLLRHYEWNDFDGPGEPLTGGSAALVRSFGEAVQGIGATPFKWAKSIKKKERYDKHYKGRARKNQVAARKSSESEVRPQANQRTEKPAEDEGKLSHGGHHGAETNLPAGNLGHGGVRDEMANMNSLGNRSAVKPQSEDKTETGDDDNNSLSSENTVDGDIAHNLAVDTGAGLLETGGAIAKAPMDLFVAVAQGFHNAPRLYGDTTVRRPTRITGIKSGVRAGGEEFAYGIYDAFTGVVKQPYQGAKNGGALGAIKGTSRGVGGLVLKNLAAVIGPPAYTVKGVHKEIVKRRQPTHFLRKARIIQGGKDIRALSAKDRENVLATVDKSWRIIMSVKGVMAEVKGRGLKGRLQVYQERRRWRKYGVFENVENVGRALEAYRRGEDFEDVFDKLREEIRRSEGPRKSTMRKSKSKRERGGGGRPEKKENNEDPVLANEETGTQVVDQATAIMEKGADEGYGSGTTVNGESAHDTNAAAKTPVA